MEIGGLMAHAIRLFIGNPDIMGFLLTWMVFCTLALTVLEINKESKT